MFRDDRSPSEYPPTNRKFTFGVRKGSSGTRRRTALLPEAVQPLHERGVGQLPVCQESLRRDLKPAPYQSFRERVPVDHREPDRALEPVQEPRDRLEKQHHQGFSSGVQRDTEPDKRLLQRPGQADDRVVCFLPGGIQVQAQQGQTPEMKDKNNELLMC